MTTRALVLHSGGLDSTVCMHMALEKGREVISLGIDYGQRHRVELDYAAEQCRRLGIPRRVLSVSWTKPDRIVPMGRKPSEIGGNISSAFLPARNGVFLMLASAEAAGLDARELWIGVNSINFSGYPDCTPQFIDAFKQMLKIGNPKGPKLVAPLQSKSKRAITLLARKFGLSQSDTWSCYRPSIGAIGVSPCGECDACALHSLAWA